MQDGGDVKAVFTRFCALSEAMKASTEAAGASLMHNAALGYIGTCPSNLGTGMRASVMIELANLNENVPLLHKICEMYDLQPRGSAGEHSAALGARWDISNKQRIGFSEVELAQKMIDGVCMVICAEEALASGTTPAALAAATAPASLKVLLNVIPTPECVKACGTDACDGGHHKACQHARAAADSPLSNLFGTTIVTKDGERDTNEVLAGKKHIMVYFSAHWCPPCRGYTPELSEAYAKSSKQGECAIVFVSSDRSQEDFNSYYAEMDFFALPFTDRVKKDELSDKYGVQGIPTLVLLDGSGELVNGNIRGQHGDCL